MANVTDIQASPFKADFPLLVNNPELVFLDSAATAQRPAAVIDAERSFYETMNANPLRGLYKLSVDATAAIDQARAKVAAFVGADDPAEVIFTRNASESLNLIAKTLGPTVLHEGDEVCISIMEHHSNLIPWQQVCRASGAKLVFLRPDDQGVIGPEEIAAKIGPKTKIVSVTHVSNVLGVENPIRAIADAGHAQGAIVIADGAQSLPHVLVDVKELGVDAFAFSNATTWRTSLSRYVSTMYGSKPSTLPSRMPSAMLYRWRQSPNTIDVVAPFLRFSSWIGVPVKPKYSAFGKEWRISCSISPNVER